MAKQKWRTFEEARFDVEAYNTKATPLAQTRLLSLQIMGPKMCPAPSWDPAGTYQVALHGQQAVIEKRLPGGEWVAAPLDPPATTPSP